MGLVSPDVFIPLAEESGDILAIGSWVLDAGIRQVQAWHEGGQIDGDFALALNVSSRQLLHEGFVEGVLRRLATAALPPGRLKIEVTESGFIHDIAEARVRLAALREAGIGVSIDDFGTGYSSLSYLKRLPLDQVKIDQSFVRDVLTDPNYAAIVRTILALAKSLDLEVVAEGVETTGQLSFLRLHGCEGFQGYLFGRPGPVELFEREHLPGHSAPSLATSQPAQQEQRP